MERWDNAETRDLLRTILGLKTLPQAKRFFRDLLTEEELVEFGKRWQAARMLHAGVPYATIQKKTGLSSTTVARISKWLQNGMNGYKSALKQNIHHRHPSPPSEKGLR